MVLRDLVHTPDDDAEPDQGSSSCQGPALPSHVRIMSCRETAWTADMQPGLQRVLEHSRLWREGQSGGFRTWVWDVPWRSWVELAWTSRTGTWKVRCCVWPTPGDPRHRMNSIIKWSFHTELPLNRKDIATCLCRHYWQSHPYPQERRLCYCLFVRDRVSV